MRIACWLTKATDPHSEYVILIAFPPQQWLKERPLMLRYTYLACLVSFYCVRCNTQAQLLVLYLLLVTPSIIHSTISELHKSTAVLIF
jgi:hypothetical protein